MDIFYNRKTAYELEKMYGRTITQRVLRYMRGVGMDKVEHRAGASVQTFPFTLVTQLAMFIAWEERNIQALPGSEGGTA